MKKHISFALVCMFAIGFAACGDPTDPAPSPFQGDGEWAVQPPTGARVDIFYSDEQNPARKNETLAELATDYTPPTLSGSITVWADNAASTVSVVSTSSGAVQRIPIAKDNSVEFPIGTDAQTTPTAGCVVTKRSHFRLAYNADGTKLDVEFSARTIFMSKDTSTPANDCSAYLASQKLAAATLSATDSHLNALVRHGAVDLSRFEKIREIRLNGVFPTVRLSTTVSPLSIGDTGSQHETNE